MSGSLGALVGLERQWDEQSRDPEARVPAGLRTFALWGILGTLCAYFAAELHPMVFAAGLIAIALWTAAHIGFRSQEPGGAGLTTAAGSATVYLVGGLAYAGQWKLAVMLTVVLLILLAGKTTIHGLSRKFTAADVRMALQFLAVTGVILPLVPDQDFGPYGAFNPRSVWMMVVIVSGLGFAGYVAVRMLGPSLGIALTGIAGGLASSTATTLSMSRASRERPDLAGDYSLAIIVACTVMLWRVGVLVFAVSPALAMALLPDLAAMSVPGVGCALWQVFRRRPSPAREEAYKNPLSLRIALQFAALYAIVVLVVKAAEASFGEAGLLAASFLSGLTDLDAIALSLANLFGSGNQSANFLIACIVLAAVANSATKLGLAWVLGEPGLRRRVAALLGATILVGLGLFTYRLVASA